MKWLYVAVALMWLAFVLMWTLRGVRRRVMVSKRRRMLEGWDGWTRVSTRLGFASWQESIEALDIWQDAGGRITPDGHFVPPLPLYRRLNREALGDWLVRNSSFPLDWFHVERNKNYSITWAYGLDAEPFHQLKGRRARLYDTTLRAVDDACNRISIQTSPDEAHRDARIVALRQRLRDMSFASTTDMETLASHLAAESLAIGLRTATQASRVAPAADGSTEDASTLRQRIADVMADAERRRLDICEVIEHNALFQTTDPVTAEFERYAIEVRDTPLALRTAEQLRPMVAKLETLWKAAVQNAERRGLSALSDPALGSTAVKLARTATDERTSLGERTAAATKLSEALRSLGLPATTTGAALSAAGIRLELTEA